MSNIAISVSNVSKTFVIPREKISTLRGAFVSALHDKSYEKFSALKNVSFEVKKGEFFGIIGRNGSGKSTLLKILASIYTADKGNIKINGLVSPFLELGIGFNPELSGRDNIYLNASVLGLTKKQIDQKFDDIVAFSELKRFIDQKVKNYSSGMNVRLAFSVAIHANRDILLMDEVLAVGDSNFQGKCMEEFNKYRDQGKTVVLVTHDISTVQRYCDRAMLLRNGKIELIGNPEKVGNKYIYQNMSDEEKRMFNEEKRLRLQAEKEANVREKEGIRIQKEAEKKAREEKKIKIARITKVEFLDKNGKAKNVFKTGEKIDMKVYFKRNKHIDDINIGIGLYSDDNSYVFSYNTQMDKYKIGRIKDCITLSFDSLPLLKGNYYLNVVCFGKEEQSYYDLSNKIKVFKVFPILESNNYRGVVSIKHQWK